MKIPNHKKRFRLKPKPRPRVLKANAFDRELDERVQVIINVNCDGMTDAERHKYISENIENIRKTAKETILEQIAKQDELERVEKMERKESSMGYRK